MEFICNQQYIHYSKSGFIYYFYVINKKIYMKTFHDNKIYETIKIAENIVDYSVTIDDFGNFHLISICSSGELKYSIYKDNKWDFRLLTQYDSKYYQFKNLKIFIVHEHIHILIAVSNILDSKLWILKHYYWNTQSWINKKVCTIITEKYDIPFHVDIDSNHNIHIVFKSLSNKKYQIYYCRYQATYNSWSIPTRISDPAYNHFHPFVFCDNIKGTHIVWSRYYHKNMEIFYLCLSKLNTSKSYLEQVQKLSNEKTNCTHPYILQVGNYIKVLWKQNNEYFFKTSNIFDNIWNPSTKVQFDPKYKLYTFSVIGNHYKSLVDVKIRNTYGMHINNNFFIIGIDHSDTIDKQTTNPLCTCNPLYSNDKENIDTVHLYNQINLLIDMVQDIQKKYENIDQVLNNLNDHQKLVEMKVDKLIKYDEILATADHNLFEKITHFFKS
ncbi:hypothetical protein [Crassaminicella profunda]|uniref:hypothetical protein n=1 Tax=Crassaminicella profunda TaxID=1286698 RepID=UPI001CA75CAE|nr:hypothetical protein [Crassaminicella profunda]QZY57023.1 hypothetical protein K7H06_08930 [Crassaminicella profunda]